MVEAGLVIAAVAQRYSLRLVPGQQIAVEPSVTLRPKHGLMMTLIEARKDSDNQT